MAGSPFRVSALLAALCATIPATAATPAHAAPIQMFSSCQDIHRAIPIARDGTYLLYNNGNIFTVYCSRMATIMPSEYIDLARTGQNVNFSQYTAGGASPGTNVRTTFTKLRVDPRTLTVDIGDQTFATSTGSLRHGSMTVTSMPYGVAMSCTSKADGRGNIDLQDTPFRVDNAFATGGFKASGSATPSPSGQVVDLHGGGFCGWTMSVPELYNPFNPSPGTYHLKVNCAQNGVLPARRQICVHLGGTAGLTTQVRRDGGRPSVIVWQDGRPVAASGLDGRARFLG